MNIQPLSDHNPLPLVITPHGDVAANELVDWLGAHRDELAAHLHRVGGLLLRGFSVRTPEAFRAIVETFSENLLDYVAGNSPRTHVSDKIYTSTEHPPARSIPIHNEMSYCNVWPGRIFFYCHVAPDDRGETPIADSRRILARLPPGTRDRFERNGVCYVQNLHNGRLNVGKSWQAAFETEDKTAVEAACREKDIEWEWRASDSLRLTHRRSAVATHPITGERVWFNQADLWHPSNLPATTLKALRMTLGADELPNNVCYGDGSEIPAEDLGHVRAAQLAESVLFPWRAGDVLVLDNMLAGHGRSPFSGARKILVAMTQ